MGFGGLEQGGRPTWQTGMDARADMFLSEGAYAGERLL